jgi:phosphoglycolate phosphatase-like HAD superfamily hydrolase
MGLFERWRRARRSESSTPGPEDASRSGSPEAAPANPRGLSGWVEARAESVVKRAYESHAEDLEERARRVVAKAYEHSADDIEERAVRAMRRAIEAEAERIKLAIEHGIAVKKREVRWSLLVLIVSSLVYLGLHWFATRQVGP